jgi:hypothetical protein
LWSYLSYLRTHAFSWFFYGRTILYFILGSILFFLDYIVSNLMAFSANHIRNLGFNFNAWIFWWIELFITADANLLMILFHLLSWFLKKYSVSFFMCLIWCWRFLHIFFYLSYLTRLTLFYFLAWRNVWFGFLMALRT